MTSFVVAAGAGFKDYADPGESPLLGDATGLVDLSSPINSLRPRVPNHTERPLSVSIIPS